MILRITISLITTAILTDIVLAKDDEYKTYNSLSYTLGSILKTDTEVIKMEYNSAILKRFDNYREGIFIESKKIYPLIPTVWGMRPTLDTTSLYTPYIQKYTLSCEIAAVRMIMESFGKRYSEESIYRSIPRSPGVLSGGIWGDPDEEFVGYLTGTQGGRTGYGIYEKPLSDYLTKRGYTTEIINASTYTPEMTPHAHLVYLLGKVKLGSRVILWGDWCTDTAYEDGILGNGGRWILRYFPLAAKNICSRSSDERQFSWKTEEGKEIQGLSGEHTFILLGYIGSKNWISHIIVWDTYTGRHIFSYEEWMRKWELMEYRSMRVTIEKSL